MLHTFEILFDVGLLVLILMVQLVVYPSFIYYEPKNLVEWHQKYTGQITVIVAPLMFGQLGISIYQFFDVFNAISAVKLVFIVFVWAFTFVYFVPAHGRITKGIFSKELLKQLVRLNWWRTLAWSLVFIISFYQLMNN